MNLRENLFFRFGITLAVFCSFLCMEVSADSSHGIEKIKKVVVERWSRPFKEISICGVIGGLSNDNYIVYLDQEPYFVRYRYLQNDQLGSSFLGEYSAVTMVAPKGLAPAILFWDPHERILVSEFIEGCSVDLHQERMMVQFCERLRFLHSLRVEFIHEFCPVECIQKLLANALLAKAELSDVFFTTILPKVSEIQTTLKHRHEKVPCHLDLNNLNVIARDGKLFFIDWEYAAMGDPLYDLAMVSSSEFFTDDEMKCLLKIYLEREPLEHEQMEFYCMRILADIRTALWCYLQEKISIIPATFHEGGDLFVQQILKRLHQMDSSGWMYSASFSQEVGSLKLNS